MNENIDLTKILEGCPEGTEFYHAGYGRVWFVRINLDSDYPIRFKTTSAPYIYTDLTKKGTLYKDCDGDCLLYPSKTHRDWGKFERFWDKLKIEKFDINTLQPFDKVLVRSFSQDKWKPIFFGFQEGVYSVCLNSRWNQCIPYNEKTKYLTGTTNDCPEYYKWWEE